MTNRQTHRAVQLVALQLVALRSDIARRGFRPALAPRRRCCATWDGQPHSGRCGR